MYANNLAIFQFVSKKVCFFSRQSFLYRNVKIAGRARMVLSPTMSELPLVGGIQFFFLTKPEIDFVFDGLARIADLPVIKKKIKEFGPTFDCKQYKRINHKMKF